MKKMHSELLNKEWRNLPPVTSRGLAKPKKNPYLRLDSRTEDFFKTPERDGGPVDPLSCFEEIYMTIFAYDLIHGNQKLNS